jgi:hypothetical protein
MQMKRGAFAAMIGLAGLLAACSSSSKSASHFDNGTAPVIVQSGSPGVTSTGGTGTSTVAAPAGPQNGPASSSPGAPGSTQSSKPGTNAKPGSTSQPAAAFAPGGVSYYTYDPGSPPPAANNDPNVAVGPVIQITPDTGVSPGASQGPPPTVAPGPVGNPSITLVQMCTVLAADGSAGDPRTVFYASTDTKVVAVATLNNLPAGTQINFVHIHGNSYTPSSTTTLKTPLKHFYIQFAAAAGQTLKTGQYRIRYYVNGQAAYDISYEIR